MKCDTCGHEKHLSKRKINGVQINEYHCLYCGDVSSKNIVPSFKQPGDFENGKIVSSGEKRQFSTGSQRDSANGKPRTELLPDDLLSRVATWYGLGAEKYGDNNWRLGQPQTASLGSLKRHLAKWENGDTDEDHLSAVIFNALSIMNVEMYHQDKPELLFVKYKDQIKKHE